MTQQHLTHEQVVEKLREAIAARPDPGPLLVWLDLIDYADDELHLHQWCRETGSSALICLGCGSVWDHGVITPAKSLTFLDEMRDNCHCYWNRP